MSRQCEADNCEKERHFTKPYCRMHLARLKRTGTLGGFKAIYNYEKICKTEGCEEKYTRAESQLCEWHYDDYREQVRAAATERLRDASELIDIDYEDYWQWVKKELNLV